MKFSELNLNLDFINNLEENNFTECTTVQEMSLPHILDKKSLMVQAQTGTGKTAAFLIPLLEKLVTQKKSGNKLEHTQKKPIGLVVAPTRELASQINEDAEILGGTEFNIPGVVLCGGVSIEKQRKQLQNAQFIIATPGRLLDFASRMPNLLSEVTYFVLDESDRLFDMGFYTDLKKIIQLLPSAENRISMLFSATLPQKVRSLAKQDFHKAIEIDVPSATLAVDKIKQELVYLLHNEKITFTLGLLKELQESQSAVIFTNTKHLAESLSLKLAYNGINCDYINGDLPQNKRQRVIQKMKTGKISVLIATDVAARGIHIHDLDLVINYDIPDDPENYVHRIGRTGRAGKDGEAITLVCDRFAYNLEGVQKLLKHKIPQVEYAYQEKIAEDISKNVLLKDLAKSANKILRTSHRSNSNSQGQRFNQGRNSSRNQQNRNKNRKFDDNNKDRNKKSSGRTQENSNYSNKHKKTNTYRKTNTSSTDEYASSSNNHKKNYPEHKNSDDKHKKNYLEHKKSNNNNKKHNSDKKDDNSYTKKSYTKKKSSNSYSQSHTQKKHNTPSKQKSIDSITQKAINKINTLSPQNSTNNNSSTKNQKGKIKMLIKKIIPKKNK